MRLFSFAHTFAPAVRTTGDPFPTSKSGSPTGVSRPNPKYWAFISYSHRDAGVANALQRAIETYSVPKHLVGRRTAAGEVPPRLKPIFLDRHELQAGADLKAIVIEALAASRYLIVVCSPDAARSAWVNQEIIEFKKLHGESRVLAVIAAGEPFASCIDGRTHEECFPEALRSTVTSPVVNGGTALEPIASDLRPHADGKRRATLKLIAGMIGVGADELIRRHAKRRMRQLMLVAAASLAGMAAMSVLAVSAVRSRNEAHVQRSEAEDLLEYMLGDLRKKLEPVGRLDVLDGVGTKALTYYARQDADQLDANSLGRRSRALHLIGEMHEQRGQLDAAQSAFQRAADTTAQLLARAPNDGHRIFDHAQSVYWVGHLAWLRGQVTPAEEAFRNYLELAEQLVRIDGQNLDWQAETAYAHDNIGVVGLHTSRVAEALDELARARTIWQRLVATQPPRAFDLANNIGWIAKAYEAQGSFARAIDTQKEKMSVLQLVPNAESNQQVRRSVRVINSELAKLEMALGRAASAQAYAMTALQSSQALVKTDPQNKTWLESLYFIHVTVAEVQMALGHRTAARENAHLALSGSAQLLALDPKVASWQVNLRGRALTVAAELSTDAERPGLSEELRVYLETIRQFTTTARELNQTRDVIVAQAEYQLGVLLAHGGRTEEAAQHWRGVVARMSPYAAQDDLPALTVMGTAQFRLGALAEARALARRIESSTYRHPAYADLVRLLSEGAGLSVAQP